MTVQSSLEWETAACEHKGSSGGHFLSQPPTPISTPVCRLYQKRLKKQPAKGPCNLNLPTSLAKRKPLHLQGVEPATHIYLHHHLEFKQIVQRRQGQGRRARNKQNSTGLFEVPSLTLHTRVWS